MSFIFVSSTGDHAGQSLLSWALCQRLTGNGKNIGYFKPFCIRPILVNDIWTDSDAVLFKEVLNISDPLETICPNVFHENITEMEGPAGTIEEIISTADQLSRNRDALIISGSKHAFFNDLPYAIPDASIISKLDANFVLIHRFKKTSTTLYSLLSITSLLKANLKGIVINRVPGEYLDETRKSIIPVLKKNGVLNIAILTEDPLLSCRNLREIRDLLKGRILYGEEYLDRLVDRMTVGTGNLHNELKILKRVYNKIILIGPSGDIAGILLTSNRMPPDQVIEAAKISTTPLIMVKDDSFSALEHMEKTVPELSSGDTDKASHFINMLDRDNFLNKLIESF